MAILPFVDRPGGAEVQRQTFCLRLWKTIQSQRRAGYFLGGPCIVFVFLIRHHSFSWHHVALDSLRTQKERLHVPRGFPEVSDDPCRHTGNRDARLCGISRPKWRTYRLPKRSILIGSFVGYRPPTLQNGPGTESTRRLETRLWRPTKSDW